MTESIHSHYDNPENQEVVEKRFAYYDYAKPRINVHDEEVKALSRLGLLTGVEARAVLDVGSGKGDMLPRLKKAGFQGAYIGLDFSGNQLIRTRGQSLFSSSNILMARALADNLPVQDESVDSALVNYILYHENEAERIQTYSELRRVTKPHGVVIAATSGAINKSTQRTLEAFVGEDVGSKAPDPMNVNFTSEKAETELRENFRNWHLTFFEQHGIVVLFNEARIDASIDSIRTARDQYVPVPSKQVFEESLAKIKRSLMQAATDGMPRVDNVHRTFVLMSREPTGLPERVVLS